MLLILLIIFLVLLCLIERELDAPEDQGEPAPETCQKCGAEASPDHLICTSCRTLLREHCRTCGHSKIVAHHYCPWCGTASEKGSPYAA